MISLLVVSALDGGSLWETVQIDWQMFAYHAVGQSGIHFGFALSGYPGIIRVLVVIGTGVTGAMLVYCFRRGLLAADVLPLNSLLCLWTLLAAYHRSYDTMVTILFLIFCLSAITTWQCPLAREKFLACSGCWHCSSCGCQGK